MTTGQYKTNPHLYEHPSNASDFSSNSNVVVSHKSYESEISSFDDIAQRKRSFKEKKTFTQRVAESRNIKTRFPNKVPVVVERHPKEKMLPQLDKNKYLVPQELNMSHFVIILRNRMQVSHSQAVYLYVNDKHMVGMSMDVISVYNEYRDPDGFLYLSYTSQETFGAGTK